PGAAGFGGRAVRDVPRHRQQRRVTPDVLCAGLNVGPGQPREVIADLERPETLVTRVVGPEPGGFAAPPAGQARRVAEAGDAGRARTGSPLGFANREARGGHGARALSPILPPRH